MNPITLLYHDVVEGTDYASSGFPGGDADVYKMGRAHFTRHMDAVAQAIQGEVALATSINPDAAKPQVFLTFDDGGVSSLTVIADILEERGWRGHFFISTDFTGKPGFLTRSQIAEMHRRGHAIGSHSCSHPPRLSHCPPNVIEDEWRRSVETLRDILGADAPTASVPGGFHSTVVARKAAAAGIRYLFNSEPTTSLHTVDGCLILGRYSIQQQTPANWAAAVARGDRAPRLKQAVFWNTKKVLKKLGGKQWLAIRRRLLKSS